MRFSVLASGSGGNAVYLESGATRLLVDGGLSGRELVTRLLSIGADPAGLNGILVTHEHADHILGVGILARRFDLPVYIHSDTLGAAARHLGWLPHTVCFDGDDVLEVGDLRVRPFPIPHDAVNPLGFTFSRNGKKIGLATDMGYVQSLARERLKGSNALILESNHDLEMLKEGPYAWSLKQRVMGRTGHLSNDDSSVLLGELLHDRLQCVVLAHLSAVNNLPRIAESLAREVIRRSGQNVRLTMARQGEAGALIEV